MSYEFNPRKRVKLYKQFGGMCHWCWQKVKLDGDMNAPDFATIDHIYHRQHQERRKSHNGGPCVLACFRCNNERSLDQNREIASTKKARKKQKPH